MSTDVVHPALADRWRFLTWTEAAAYVALSERQLRRAVEARKLSFTRMGREIRFTKEQLDAYVEKCTFRPEDVS
jgi:excisionase family DNA binding protein